MPVWSGLLGLFTLLVWLDLLPLGRLSSMPWFRWQLLVVWSIVTAFLAWSLPRLRKVEVDDEFLYVSNYKKEIRVPLGEIRDCIYHRWWNPPLITVHLLHPCEFGSKFLFVPKTSWIKPLISHPVMEELQSLARQAQGRSGMLPPA